MSDKYVWITWSVLSLIPWALVFIFFPSLRQRMLIVSLATMLFGLSEPLFIPEYWNPKTLFDFAQKTGFDIESLIFCFGIGGIATVSYSLLTGQKLTDISNKERMSKRYRYHKLAMLSPIAIFLVLSLFGWNIIYPVIFAFIGGNIATMICRSDLWKNSLIGGGIFVVYYFMLLLVLKFGFPGYIDRYWNLKSISGIKIVQIPIEEFLFALGFGMYWSSLYEHLFWKKAS